jgi:hypothetical protein
MTLEPLANKLAAPVGGCLAEGPLVEGGRADKPQGLEPRQYHVPCTLWPLDFDGVDRVRAFMKVFVSKARGGRSYPRVTTMVPTLSLSLRPFTLAAPGNGAIATPDCPMALSPGGCLALNGYGFTLRPLPRDRSNQDFKQRSRARAAPFRARRYRFRGGECR